MAHNIPPGLTYQQAVHHMENVRGIPLRQSSYAYRCTLDCESYQDPLDVVPFVPPSWPSTDIRAWPPPAGHPGPTRNNILHPVGAPNPLARFLNASTGDAFNPLGYDEPSCCIEDPNTPVAAPETGPGPPYHISVHPRGELLVCAPCKTARRVYFRNLLDSISLGVCKTCRTWALQNMIPGDNRCICEPHGNYAGTSNNNEPRKDHLCARHASAYWTRIRQNANTELDWRQQCVRRNRKNATNFAKKKQHGTPQPRTPDQRRRASRRTNPARHPAPDPRCYCGEIISYPGANGNPVIDGHSRTPGTNTAQVRSCLGCGFF